MNNPTKARVVPPQNEDFDWQLFKDVTKHSILEPMTAGVAFGLAWLGTFYFLKKRLNIE